MSKVKDVALPPPKAGRMVATFLQYAAQANYEHRRIHIVPLQRYFVTHATAGTAISVVQSRPAQRAVRSFVSAIASSHLTTARTRSPPRDGLSFSRSRPSRRSYACSREGNCADASRKAGQHLPPQVSKIITDCDGFDLRVEIQG